MNVPKAMIASFWPQKRRRWWYPDNPELLVLGAAVTGIVECLVGGYLELHQFRRHFVAQADWFSRGNEASQTVALFFVVIAEVFYPLSLLLIFLTVEGFIRAVAALVTHEALPSLPVKIGVALWERRQRKRAEALADEAD